MRQNPFVGIAIVLALIALAFSRSVPSPVERSVTIVIDTPWGATERLTFPESRIRGKPVEVRFRDGEGKTVMLQFDVPPEFIPMDDHGMLCLESAPVAAVIMVWDGASAKLTVIYGLSYADGTPVVRSYRMAGKDDWT